MFTIKNDTLKKINGGSTGLYSCPTTAVVVDYYASKYMHRINESTIAFGLVSTLQYNNCTGDTEQAFLNSTVVDLLNRCPDNITPFLSAINDQGYSEAFPKIGGLRLPIVLSTNSTEE